MTTDNTQEPRDLIQICTDIYYECETIKRLDELTDEALDWHNEQTLELLDRLENQVKSLVRKPDGTSIGAEYIPLSAIEAERNKLKGRDDEGIF